MKKQFNIRLDQSDYDRLVQIAEANCRSMTGQIEYWIRNEKEMKPMKKAILRHDDVKGFILVDEEGSFVVAVDTGNNSDEVDWELIEKQANKFGYSLE